MYTLNDPGSRSFSQMACIHGPGFAVVKKMVQSSQLVDRSFLGVGED